MNHRHLILLAAVAPLLTSLSNSRASAAAITPAADWPMWRGDAARTACSAKPLPEPFHLQWVREYPLLSPAFWQVRQERLQFDLGYEPVVMGQTLFIGSSRNDRVTALDTETGAERWRFYADGPVRAAPVASQGRLYFASDDGCLYCLDATSGSLQWKVRGAPSPRKVLGNGRLISVWPARGGPVLADGRIYFAAGVWPFEGIFVQAVDAADGHSVWINDRTGSLYAEHPHGAWSFGGPSPQGYLLIHRGRLVVPSSRAFPAYFDLATGKLLQFDFGHGGHGSRPGSWFVATDADGQLCVDTEINTETHDVGQQVIGQAGIRKLPKETLQATVTVGGESYRVKTGVARAVRLGDREYRFRDGFPEVEGPIHTMLAADGKLFVVTRAGRLYCFGPKAVAAKSYPVETQPLPRPSDAWTSRTAAILKLTGNDEGYALLWGGGTGRLAAALASQSKLQLVAIEPDARKVDGLRRQFDAAGLYGHRVAAHVGNPLDSGLPRYLASLIVCEDLDAAGFAAGAKWLATVFQSLRPYGGTLCVETTDEQHAAIGSWIKQPSLAGAQLRREGWFTLVVRAGPLPGTADYTGGANGDQLVKAPLGLLWFGDTAHHHKLFYPGFTHEAGRGLPSYLNVVLGVMSYFVAADPIGQKTDVMSYQDFLRYVTERKYVPVHIDIYTGRALSSGAAEGLAPSAASPAKQPLPLSRQNPITGAEEAREFLKMHGCDQFGADYGNLITMRSGTAAFYDKRSESGTVNISGIRSGCRNSMVPAGGVLSLPAWTGNCTCNYPVFTSLALVAMPPEYEQWSAWGGLAVDAPIQRVGINFGAPGDRMAEDGTLWLDWPSVGGPSPDVRVRVVPETVEPFYRHSLRMQGGTGWPWVFASGIQGVRSIQLETVARSAPVASDRFSVRWTGQVEPPATEDYTFHARSDGPMRVWVGNRLLLDSTLRPPRNGQREVSGKLALTAGTKYDLLVEYKHVPAGDSPPPALAELSWRNPAQPRTAIPAQQLFAPDGRRGGLVGAYFGTDRLTGPALFQRDPQVRCEWGNRLPVILQGRVHPVQPVERAYTVRLAFAEPEPLRIGQRVFSVKLQGREVLRDFDILRDAGGPDRGVVREFSGIRARETIALDFDSSTPKLPLICGIELIAG